MKDNTVSYRDGSEQTLLTVVQGSDFDEQTAWKKHTTWPMQYHLSPARKNLLRWHDFGDKPIDILELGAGCGALTSFFVALPNARLVTAIEGSESRSKVIRERCRHAANCNVVTANIVGYVEERRYDIVTLIGVLEYAGKYITAADPFTLLLKKAASFLKPDGILILAIENRLGHKYFAGLNEDHYKQPFEGIANYPHYNGVKTFDKNTLRELLHSADLPSQKWLYPFPDYKMPQLVLTDNAFTTAGFDWLTLLNLPTADAAFNKRPLFSERELLKGIIKNADATVFMNSFLVFASRSKTNLISDAVLAAYMRTKIAQQYQTIKIFRNQGAHDIVVDAKNITSGKTTTQSYLQNHQNFFTVIVDAWQTKQYSHAVTALVRWLDIISKNTIPANETLGGKFAAFSKKHLGLTHIPTSDTWLDLSRIDLITQNILMDSATQKLTVIDQEWSAPTHVPAKLVIDRGMYYLVKKMQQLTGASLLTKNGVWNMPEEIIRELPITVSKPNLALLYHFERWFQAAVKEGDMDLALDQKAIQNLRHAIYTDLHPLRRKLTLRRVTNYALRKLKRIVLR